MLKCDFGNVQYDYKRGYAKSECITKTGRQTFTYKENLKFHVDLVDTIVDHRVRLMIVIIATKWIYLFHMQ